jgi:hypothetical protein
VKQAHVQIIQNTGWTSFRVYLGGGDTITGLIEAVTNDHILIRDVPTPTEPAGRRTIIDLDFIAAIEEV